MQDAINARRTAEAVQADLSAPQEWKDTVCEHLHALMRLFLDKDSHNGSTPTVEIPSS
jgi:hypothetical protein